MKGLRLAIIDDDEMYRYSFLRQLNSIKSIQKIDVYGEAEKALQFMFENRFHSDDIPDLIFLDLDMPVMDGWQFLDEFVKLKPDFSKPVRIYVLSSSVDSADIERSRKINEISDYLIKPISMDRLEQLMTCV